jgi:hypothetical protein
MASIPSKEQCEREHARILECLMENFVSNLKDHKEKGHKFFIQGSVQSVANKLIIDKQLAIYLILGNSILRKSWGNLKEKFDLEPIKYILRREVVKTVKETLENHGAKVYFGDMDGDGNFKMRVDFYAYTKKDESASDKEADSSNKEKDESKTDSSDKEKTKFKTVARKPFKHREDGKSYAKAAKGAKVPAMKGGNKTITESVETTKE